MARREPGLAYQVPCVMCGYTLLVPAGDEFDGCPLCGHGVLCTQGVDVCEPWVEEG